MSSARTGVDGYPAEVFADGRFVPCAADRLPVPPGDAQVTGATLAARTGSRAVTGRGADNAFVVLDDGLVYQPIVPTDVTSTTATPVTATRGQLVAFTRRK